MSEVIEDFGETTHELCFPCRKKQRFNALVKVKASEEVGDWFLVCPYCDTERPAP